jgi:hypothetical protein
MGLVEGQPTADGVDGQVTTGGFEGQGFVPTDPGTDPKVEGQCSENDTKEGQENDARPFSERRPYPNTQGTQPNAVGKQGPLPNSGGRKTAGSRKR